jgi:hypothetical protein
MRRALLFLIVCAAACSTFGGSSDDDPPSLVPSPSPSPPAGGGSEGGAEPDAPSGGPYATGARVTCDLVEGGACTTPSFCCISSSVADFCTTSGCDTRDTSKLACRDDTACAPGYVCCVQVDKFHVNTASCEKSCDVARDAGNGNGEFHACGAGGKAACDGGSCISLQSATQSDIQPDPELNVCR